MTADLAKLRAQTLALIDENKRLKAELAKANNEFGSETPDWPDLWKRIADLKEISNDRWRENERLRDATNQCRLAFAGSVSVASAIRKLDTLIEGGPDDH